MLASTTGQAHRSIVVAIPILVFWIHRAERDAAIVCFDRQQLTATGVLALRGGCAFSARGR